MAYPVEKGVPIPKPVYKDGVGKIPLYPYGEMEVGDSFFISCDETEIPRRLLSTRIAGSSRAWRLRHADKPRKFASRLEKDGIRVWRIE